MEISKFIDTLLETERIKNNIFLDFDCTLVKSIDPVLNELNRRYGTNVKPNEIKTWNFIEVNENMTTEEIEEIFASDYFYDNLEFYDGAEDFLKSHENNVIIVTKGTPLNLYKKKLWLDNKGFENIKFIGLPINVSKKFIDMSDSIFIDDSTYNLEDSNARIKIQFRQFNEENEWNKDWNGWLLTKWN